MLEAGRGAYSAGILITRREEEGQEVAEHHLDLELVMRSPDGEVASVEAPGGMV